MGARLTLSVTSRPITANRQGSVCDWGTESRPPGGIPYSGLRISHSPNKLSGSEWKRDQHWWDAPPFSPNPPWDLPVSPNRPGRVLFPGITAVPVARNASAALQRVSVRPLRIPPPKSFLATTSLTTPRRISRSQAEERVSESSAHQCITPWDRLVSALSIPYASSTR